MLRFIGFILLITMCGILNAGSEADQLWENIDSLNRELAGHKGRVSGQALELSFGRAVHIVKNRLLSAEFERLREDAFARNDFKRLDAAIERCRPAIDAFILGESNNIGVNVGFFLKICERGDGYCEFLTLAQNGFYIAGNIYGTATLPKWIRRTGSSSQGVVLKGEARGYLEKWKTLFPRLSGVYQELARETITSLRAELENR